ncbi:glutamate-1-semialdehyde 2-1-aminomutase [Apiospora rasikravindrae]|uniref:Glutamate-1-semialdehyde 2-1-aminomutase n=1 Tax=Apiospora rasikravindrae TaxID=990691 RepID=A0ABR1UA22_9PEZI
MQQIQEAYEALAREFAADNPKSKAAYEAATKSLPGGNTRTVLFYEPFPLYTERAEGCHLWDVDGHKYVDLLGEYTAGLYGHSNPVILEAIQAALKRGLSFGSHHADEARLAQLIRDRFSSIELVRFTNSGTEATLMALAAAKIFTNRSKIMVFEGGYHGGGFLFKTGPHPVNVPHQYLMAQYNDTDSVDELIAANGEDIAAIIVEPMIGSGGCIPGTPSFLAHLRERATEIGAVLVFDEVMTSRLYSGGGVQSEFGITPDITTLGKYIGGGMSFGAFGGKAEIMSTYDPRAASSTRKGASVPHAGTFNNNVLTMAAGSTGLEKVFSPNVARALHVRGDELRSKLNAISKGTILKATGCGSIMNLRFIATLPEQIHNVRDLEGQNSLLLDMLHLYMLNQGFYMARRGFIALSLELTATELDGFVEAVQGFLRKYADLVSG